MQNNSSLYVPEKYISPCFRNGCTFIPNIFLDDVRVSTCAYRLFPLILMLRLSNNGEVPSIEEIKQRLEKIIKNVEKYIEELIQLGYLI